MDKVHCARFVELAAPGPGYEGMKTYQAAAILNFLPGFGLGYLLLGRRPAFKRCVFAYAGIGAVAAILVRILLSGTTCGHYSCGVEAWAALSAAVTGSAVLALVNFPTALHLLSERSRGVGKAGNDRGPV